MAQRRLKKLAYTVPANEELSIVVDGNYARVFEANIAFQIAFDDDPFDDIEQGIGLQVADFKKVRIKNISGSTDLTVEIQIAYGRVDDDRLAITEPVVTRSGDNLDNGSVTITTSATAIAAADTDRTRLMLINNGSNTVYIGKAGVTIADGFPLEAGDVMGVENGAALYGITASGTADLRFLEEAK